MIVDVRCRLTAGMSAGYYQGRRGSSPPPDSIETFMAVGIDDNFFELGGHSLQASRILAELADGLDTRIPVKVLFENPTIRKLALQTMDILALDEKNP